MYMVDTRSTGIDEVYCFSACPFSLKYYYLVSNAWCAHRELSTLIHVETTEVVDASYLYVVVRFDVRWLAGSFAPFARSNDE